MHNSPSHVEPREGLLPSLASRISRKSCMVPWLETKGDHVLVSLRHLVMIAGSMYSSNHGDVKRVHRNRKLLT